MENRREDVEELIIQGLGHRERRNILKIISLAPQGAIYSDILGELGLNTGKMNYHLRQLDGLVERNGDRRYHLTPLGKRALTILGTMTENLENSYEKLLQDRKPPTGGGFITWANRWFGLLVFGTISAFLGLVVFVYMGVNSGTFSGSTYFFLAAIALLLIVILAWLRGWVKRESERVQSGWESILDRLLGRHR